jgi:hypothetical protein
MLRHARLRLLVAGPAGVALGSCLLHGVHAVALMWLPALLPLCGGGGDGRSAALLASALLALAAPGVQAAVLLASVVFAAALALRTR